MQTSLLNSRLSRRSLFGALLGATLFLCAGSPARAQGINFYNFDGALSFPSSLISQCALLRPRDTAAIRTQIVFGDFLDLNFFRGRKADLGTRGFFGTTASGVPVQGVGHFVGNVKGGTLTVTDITIGDPLAGGCTFSGLSIAVKMIGQ
jgi:hypothetical protein